MRGTLKDDRVDGVLTAIRIVIISAVLGVVPASARAWSVAPSGLVSLRYQTGENLTLLNPGVTYPDAGFAAVYLMPGFSLNQGDWLSADLELYTGELSPRTFSSGSLSLYGVENVHDYFHDTYFVRQAYIAVSPDDAFTLTAGEQQIIAGSRLLFDNYQPAVTAGYDLLDAFDIPLTFDLKAVKVEPYKLYDPSRTSVLYDAEVSYNFSLFEYITAFYSNFQDTDSTLAPILNNLIYSALFNRVEYDNLISKYGQVRARRIMACLQQQYAAGGPVHSSSSSISWAGMTGDRYFGRVEINLTGILETGDGSISGVNCFNYARPLDRHFSTFGYLADAKVKYHILDKAAIGLFFNLSSGDKTPAQAILTQNTLNSFLSIFPYNTESSLFFNGGINQNLSAGSLTIAGRRGLGDVAYGAMVDVYPVRSLEGTLTSVLIYPEITSKLYGIETDVTATYMPVRHVSLPFEFDYFSPGNFFQGYSIPYVMQVLFGADITW